MYPVRYEVGFYIPEDGILHSHRRKNLKSYFRIHWVTTMQRFERLCQLSVFFVLI
jgi:hypothetical protein